MDEYYLLHSPFTAPGRYAGLLADMPRDLAGIALTAQGLVYHFIAGERRFGYRPPPERLPEIDTRYLERMVERLLELDSRPLTEARSFEHRLVGCCRDFSLLACAILRQQGVPARLRYGCASYLYPDYWCDHVVVEAWLGARWQRFDPQLALSDATPFDLLDLPAAAFVTGGRAWLLCRHEGADPDCFCVWPDNPNVRGWNYIRGILQLDIVALNRCELLCWDDWQFAAASGIPSDDDDALRDRAAALSLQADSTALRALCAEEPRLRVPAAVTCHSPAVGPHSVALKC